MKTLAEVELEIVALQAERNRICDLSTTCEGAEYEALMKTLTSVDRKLLRRRERRVCLIAARHASGFGFIGDYSRG